MHKKLTLLWFVLGLGSRLQVVASLSITEIIVLGLAPIIFFVNHRDMKRDGIMPFFILSLLVVVGCIVASIANRTPPQFILRGLAVTCIISCAIVFSHWILRRDPSGFKWFILALPISVIASTFMLRSSVEMSTLGETTQEIMEGPLFWISRVKPIVMAPTQGWYLQTPWGINIIAPLFMAGFSMVVSISGRSAALIALAFAVMVIVGGKTRRSISRISRHFWMIIIAGICFIMIAYVGYKMSAERGWLGEDARRKYDAQTEGGEGGIGRLLLGGRGESFIGLLACRDKPIVGWGPWARDENGYTEEFMLKYGTWEDYQNYVGYQLFLNKCGITDRMLSCHAYITEFWAWYGIWGLLFWLYVIFVLLRYLKQDVAAVPQWFAWVACSIPGVFWGIFFSPFSDRVATPLLVVACLMARAIREGRFKLPQEMMREIEKAESR